MLSAALMTQVDVQSLALELPAAQHAPLALVTSPATKAKLPKLTGIFRGSLSSVWGFRTQVKLTVTSQSGSRFKGKITSSDEPALRLTFTGTVKASGKFSGTFSGYDKDGRLKGLMNGTVNSAGRIMRGSYRSQGEGGLDKGSFSLSR